MNTALPVLGVLVGSVIMMAAVIYGAATLIEFGMNVWQSEPCSAELDIHVGDDDAHIVCDREANHLGNHFDSWSQYSWPVEPEVPVCEYCGGKGSFPDYSGDGNSSAVASTNCPVCGGSGRLAVITEGA